MAGQVVIKRGNYLPDEDHVVRYVAWNRLRKDGDGKVLGVLPQAFILREVDAGGLSVKWLEYFRGSKDSNLLECVKEFRSTMRPPHKKSVYVVAQVAKVKAIFQRKQKRVQVIYAPTQSSKCHSEIRADLNEDLALLDELASEFAAQMHFDNAIK